ncbi:MAG: hypothetical protein QNJ32_09855 [Xenococcaceae cyanobacterium MO_167.B27]|nr:hypothetical protein [Xenococcaceae cyanobacterium MO_167.B27]
MESPLNCTSANFEKVALSKFRSLTPYLPNNIRISREPWGRFTVLCIDFQDCPQYFPPSPEQNQNLIQAMKQLGLSNSIIFRIGNKILGWKRV